MEVYGDLSSQPHLPITETSLLAPTSIYGASKVLLESSLEGFMPFNVAAPDVCLDVPTQELLAEFYPHLKDRRAPFDDHQCPFDATALRRTLGWTPEFDWRRIRDEAQAD